MTEHSCDVLDSLEHMLILELDHYYYLLILSKLAMAPPHMVMQLCPLDMDMNLDQVMALELGVVRNS
jgi:hypothetical protein